MKSISGREFAKILERKGWQLLRIQGSHYIYGKTGNVSRITVPIHGNQPLRKGLQRHLMKQANIADDDL